MLRCDCSLMFCRPRSLPELCYIISSGRKFCLVSQAWPALIVWGDDNCSILVPASSYPTSSTCRFACRSLLLSPCPKLFCFTPPSVPPPWPFLPCPAFTLLPHTERLIIRLQWKACSWLEPKHKQANKGVVCFYSETQFMWTPQCFQIISEQLREGDPFSTSALLRAHWCGNIRVQMPWDLLKWQQQRGSQRLTRFCSFFLTQPRLSRKDDSEQAFLLPSLWSFIHKSHEKRPTLSQLNRVAKAGIDFPIRNLQGILKHLNNQWSIDTPIPSSTDLCFGSIAERWSQPAEIPQDWMKTTGVLSVVKPGTMESSHAWKRTNATMTVLISMQL